MIYVIFGKKGSGKSVMSKEIMVNLGGRVIFMSPVERLNLDHTEAWTIEDISAGIEALEPGDVLLVRAADLDSMDCVACQTIYDGQGFTVVIDEIDKYKESKELLDMIHYARHFDIHIVANTRRYTDVPRLLTSQADVLLVAPTNEPRDIRYLREYTDEDFVAKLADCQPFEFLQYPDKTTRKTKFVDF